LEDECNDRFPYVIIGSEVDIIDTDCGETYKFKIVGSRELNLEENCVSFLSPVGMALLLKKEGEVVTVNTPSGVYRYRVRSIMLA
jgi:transcription elongation factor GreA